MPIYEYRCDECGHNFEKIQKISDAPLTDCQSCGKPSLQKLVSAAAFQLKGEGWYVTDFKNPKKDKPAVGESSEKSASTQTPNEATNTAEIKETKKAETTSK